MTLRKVRVMKHPDGYWFWTCLVRGPDDRVDIWCLHESLTRFYTGHPAALDEAVAHATRHEPDGNLSLTAHDLLRMV